MAEFAGHATALTRAGIDHFTHVTGAAEPSLWAVLSVETSGCGFLPDRRPKILFERHKFHALTHGAYDRSHPAVSAPEAGGYGPGGAHQYDRLQQAIALDRHHALESASWGIGQIMGLYFVQAGFATVDAMVAGMVASEDAQIGALAAYLQATHLAGLLAAGDWTRFAQGYNGPDCAARNYAGLLRQFHDHYCSGRLPNLDVRAVQLGLTCHGYDPGGIDGAVGASTRAAIETFQADHGQSPTGRIDPALLALLAAAP